jgi:hypothetical protein
LGLLSFRMASIALDKCRSILHTSPKLRVWINYQKTKERRNPYSRMRSWALASSTMLLSAQESIRCAIFLATNLLQAYTPWKQLEKTKKNYFRPAQDVAMGDRGFA